MTAAAFAEFQRDTRACKLCGGQLPLGPRPVFQISRTARILIAGHAPGSKVHASGIPFDDASGDRLRNWLDLDRETFYDAKRVAILPVGFCYPGTGKSGDLPPRPECAAAWREKILRELSAVKLSLVIAKLNIDEAPELAARFRITAIPTLIVFKNGQPAATLRGVQSKSAILQSLALAA